MSHELKHSRCFRFFAPACTRDAKPEPEVVRCEANDDTVVQQPSINERQACEVEKDFSKSSITMVFFERISPLVSSSFLDDSTVRSTLSVHTNHHVAVVARRINKSFPQQSNDEDPLQKDGESCRHLISFVVIYTMIFFNGCCFTAVVPRFVCFCTMFAQFGMALTLLLHSFRSVPFYLQILDAPPEFLGFVVSFYSLGQAFGSPIAGWLSNVSTSRRMLTISSALGLISSVLYAVAPRYELILFSRLLTVSAHTIPCR